MRREGSRLIDDFDTLAGGAVAMLDAVRYVVDALGLPLADALRMATSTPARLLRPRRPHRAAGAGTSR